MDADRFSRTIKEFDRLNSEDPNIEYVGDEVIPKELLYAQRMSAQLHAFYPGPSETLQLAVRAQHICRWAIPRSAYPMTKVGYKTMAICVAKVSC